MSKRWVGSLANHQGVAILILFRPLKIWQSRLRWKTLFGGYQTSTNTPIKTKIDVLVQRRFKKDAQTRNRTGGPTMATLDFTTKPFARFWFYCVKCWSWLSELRRVNSRSQWNLREGWRESRSVWDQACKESWAWLEHAWKVPQWRYGCNNGGIVEV